MALAVEPGTDRLYVSSRGGIEVFDPADGSFTRYSRDRNLRVGALAFDADGTLWAVTWPDRRQVVRFTDRARAETVLTFDTDLDSIAFGLPGTPLRDLLFVSHNSGPGTSPGAPAPSGGASDACRSARRSARGNASSRCSSGRRASSASAPRVSRASASASTMTSLQAAFFITSG